MSWRLPATSCACRGTKPKTEIVSNTFNDDAAPRAPLNVERGVSAS
jgi:hypothetical protein